MAVGVVFGVGSLAVGWVLPHVAPGIPLISSWCIFATGIVLILLSIVAIIRPQWFHSLRQRIRANSASTEVAHEVAGQPASAPTPVDSHLREYWIEKFSQGFKECLPTNDINHRAGLRIAHLADSMPVELAQYRKEIIEHGFHRAIPGLGFGKFWKHLCEIQDWPNTP